jgi:hypothetical protein
VTLVGKIVSVNVTKNAAYIECYNDECPEFGIPKEIPKGMTLILGEPIRCGVCSIVIAEAGVED